MWQSLFDDIRDQGCVVLAVALDTPEAARPWVENARPSYPCLIDRDHHVAALYNLVNVPQAVWIDESGRVVRPPESAGATDGFRAMDRKTFTVPESVLQERTRVKNAYMDAVRDWALNGERSRHALNAQQAAARMSGPDQAVAQAHVLFRLGQHLARQPGRDAEAQALFSEATRLHPDSWAMFRQTTPKDARGLATGERFWARVDALGARPYYPPADIG